MAELNMRVTPPSGGRASLCHALASVVGAVLVLVGLGVVAPSAPARPLFDIEVTPPSGNLDTAASFTTTSMCPAAEPNVVVTAINVPSKLSPNIQRMTLRASTPASALERSGPGFVVPMTATWRATATGGKVNLPLTGIWSVGVSCVAGPGGGTDDLDRTTVFVADFRFTPVANSAPVQSTYDGLVLKGRPMSVFPPTGTSNTSTRFEAGLCGPSDTHVAFIGVPVRRTSAADVRIADLDGGGILVGPVPLDSLRTANGYALTLVQWRKLTQYLRVTAPLNLDLYQAFVCLRDGKLQSAFEDGARVYVSLLRFTPNPTRSPTLSDYVALDPSTVIPIYRRPASVEVSVPPAPTPARTANAIPQPTAAPTPTPTPSPTAVPTGDGTSDLGGAQSGAKTEDSGGLPSTGWATARLLAAAGAALFLGRLFLSVAKVRRRRT